MKLNLTAKFLFPVIVLIAVLALILSLITISVLRNFMLNRASTFVANFVTLQSRNHISGPEAFNVPSPQTDEIFAKVMNEVRTPEVVKINVWNKQKMVIYSDDTKIIGKVFNDNQEIDEALEGTVKTVIVKPNKGDNKQLMQIYIPVTFSDLANPSGVIEAYFKLDDLNIEISAAQTKVVTMIFIVFMLLAIILIMMLYIQVIIPLQVFENAVEDMEKGNLEKKVDLNTADEFGTLAKSFNRMADGIKKLQELKNEFVFIGAHELRTPVTAINGYIQLLFSEDESKSFSTTIRSYLDAIKSLNDRLSQLVTDILEIARSDAGKIEIKVVPIDIALMIRSILTEIKPLSEKKNITVTYTPPALGAKVLGDEGKLKEVIMNLVSNAVKYGTLNGYVNITHNSENNRLATTVVNNGVGIPEKQKAQIFNKFFRAENVKTRDYEGTGLGLFITRELVRKMNGEIRFESVENQETKFIFSLPISD